MKRLTYVVILAISLLMLVSGCRENEKTPTESSTSAPVLPKSSASTSIEPDRAISITPGSQTITGEEPVELVFKNHSDRTLEFGLYYTMEYKDKEWVPVDLTGMDFTGVLCVLKPGEETTQDFYFPVRFKPDLPSGLYRVTYQYSTSDEAAGDETAVAKESNSNSDQKPMQFEIMYSNT